MLGARWGPKLAWSQRSAFAAALPCDVWARFVPTLPGSYISAFAVAWFYSLWARFWPTQQRDS